MKKTYWRYLSRRCGLALIVLESFLLVLVLAFWVCILLLEGPVWLPLVASGLFGLQLAILYRWLYRPYRECEKVLRLFAGGYTMEGVFAARCLPSPATEDGIDRIQQLLSTDQLITASKRQAQYLALQNQINPHFLYNTLEGIRSDALLAGLDNVARMTEALSTFFRYTISNLEHLVTLEEELSNVDSYFLIQRYRFGERLNLEMLFDSDEDRRLLLKGKLPKLTLQPIVENAIIHGIEGRVGSGKVTIRVRGTPQRMLITVADNGLGMEQPTLDALNKKLSNVYYDYMNPDKEKTGGIALVNVNNRIRLLFGEAYGLAVYSTPGRGTDVELSLPYMTKDDVEGAAG